MTRIALLGIGNVGRAFARHLQEEDPRQPYRITAIADVSGGMYLETPGQLPAILDRLEKGALVRDCAPAGRLREVRGFLGSLPSSGIGVLVECMPTNIADGQPALDFLHSVLLSGIPVVTVDKGPMVHGFRKLTGAAATAGVGIAYTGTTGVRPPPEILGARIAAIEGILNGTTNFILTQMLEHSMAFAQALVEAQKQGVAEPNPALDTEGWDTASKITILANRWMNAEATLADVARTGIGADTESMIRTARAGQCVVRLIGRARLCETGVRVSVAPELVDPGSRFFAISGTSKGAVFTTVDGDSHFAESRSGRTAIARTILEDVQTVAPAGQL